jgi:cytochrome c oxidase cbb3-type subunit 1
MSWLNGYASGKLFLTSTGIFRFGLPSALVLLWACLAAHLWHARHSLQPAALLARGLLLVALVLVPALLVWAGNPRVYPSVNPDSGGATGASLLGSTLVVVALVGLLPWALEIKPLRERPRKAWFAGYLLFSAGVFGVIDHGNVSHHQIAAIAGLGTLLGWVPLLSDYLRRFDWDTPFRWRGALLSWWAVLVVTGFVTFLPGVSERLKFTNSLVAHAHIAMAGFVSALCFIILEPSAPRDLRAAIEQPVAFGLWQLGNVVYVVALLVLGWYESIEPGLLFSATPLTTLLYGVRLGAGVVMTAVSLWWFYRALVAKSSIQ